MLIAWSPSLGFNAPKLAIAPFVAPVARPCASRRARAASKLFAICSNALSSSFVTERVANAAMLRKTVSRSTPIIPAKIGD